MAISDIYVRTINNIEIQIAAIFDSGCSLKIDVFSTTETKNIEPFSFHLLCLEPLVHYGKDEYQVLSISPHAKLFKVVVELEYASDDILDPTILVMLRLSFWKNGHEPQVVHSIPIAQLHDEVETMMVVEERPPQIMLQ